MLRVLDSMSFHKFIEERGPPFRTCDIYDEVMIVEAVSNERRFCPLSRSTHRSMIN